MFFDTLDLFEFQYDLARSHYYLKWDIVVAIAEKWTIVIKCDYCMLHVKVYEGPGENSVENGVVQIHKSTDKLYRYRYRD